jgi:redox-sensing transcriptional repressor
MNIKLAIIAVPEEEAQGVCDLLVASNIAAIWNFAQTNLMVPKEVIVQNENIACSLAMLSKRLTEKKSKG